VTSRRTTGLEEHLLEGAGARFGGDFGGVGDDLGDGLEDRGTGRDDEGARYGSVPVAAVL